MDAYPRILLSASLKEEWPNARGKEDIMDLAIDYQTTKKTQQQHIIDLLDHLLFILTALKEVREQKHALFAQQHALFEQQQANYVEESILLQEETAILAQLASLREQTRNSLASLGSTCDSI